MTQEDRELLLKDLSGRLPYGVRCNALLKQIDGSLKSIFGTFKGYNGWASIGSDLVDIETVRPYLRPMSDMTEEEEKEYLGIDNRSYSCPIDYAHVPASERIDWLNAHHFDYHGLIPKGLAIEAPDGMYNNNKI